MKNLKLFSELSLELDLQTEDETLLFSTFDIEKNRVFFASSANLIYSLQLLSSSQNGRPWRNALLSSLGDPVNLEPGDCITALDYLMEKEALIVGTSSGFLLLQIVDLNTTEIVGRVEGGVKGIASSPDGAHLAVTTGLGKLLIMTHDWEVLHETELDPQLFDSTIAGELNGSIDPIESTIAWRGDGKYFSTLSGLHGSSLKKLSIWDRESGTLHADTDSKSFIGTALDWMPSGAKVATVYDRNAEKKCPLIVFFEKNALERSSFAIDEVYGILVDSLKWNCSSDLLAASVISDEYDAIKIWSFSNNHWYLKRELRYSKKAGVKFLWDPRKPLHLICWTIDGKITSYNFVWMTAVIETSTALVIDNFSILVSPLNLFLMPPPLSLFSLKFPCAVQDIAFFSKSSKYHLAAYLSDDSLCIVELPTQEKWAQFEGKEFFIESSHPNLTLGTFRHLTWLDSHFLLGVSSSDLRQSDNHVSALNGENGLGHIPLMEQSYPYSLQEIELVCSENSDPGLVTASGWLIKNSNRLSLDGPVIAIVSNPAKRYSAFIQLDGGSIVEYSTNLSIKGSSVPQIDKLDSDFSFSSSCPCMKAILVSDKGILKPLVFGLDNNGGLHVGRRIICNICSSFSFYSDSGALMQQVVTHLILTTKQDLLFIVSMDDIMHGNPEMQIESCVSNGIHNRKVEDKDYLNIWERGAKLVAVIHGDEAAVILQPIRGNLECIYPRKLVLVAIVNALVQERYKDAMLMVRRHRMDFNVIVDYCGWQAFLNSTAEFVRQVNSLGHITEFVCAIKNENVMNTLYKRFISLPGPKNTFPTHSVESVSLGTNKVSSVLLAVRTALQKQMPETTARELCILTTLACNEPPLLEEALSRIKFIREMELSGTDSSRKKSYPSTEEALKHLMWLSETEAVFDAALGLYDLNLAAIVALHSQKDPKEFLPFLQGLEQLPPLVMRYTIDLRLYRYESALKHIASAGDDYYEDCMKLMRDNPKLFSLGLQLFTDHAKRKQILESWGDHLHAEKRYADGAISYLYSSSIQKALKAYRACGDWRSVLTVAGILKLEKEEVLKLAHELCEELQTLGKPADAAKIALEYCADVASGIGYFVIAREWEEALRIGYLHERQDLISEVEDAAVECATGLIAEFEEGLEKVGKYVARYLAVRQRRLVLASKLQLENKTINDTEDDNVSEASTNFSGMSAYTMGTMKASGASIGSSIASKGKEMRRQRKKGGKIRAGSPGEEIALVEHLKCMSLTAAARRELMSLIHALLMMGKEEKAQQVQSVANNFNLAQCAAMKLADDTISTDVLDESTHSLEHYLRIIKSDSSISSPVLAI